MKNIPPQNLEAEQAVLGCMMISADAANYGMEVLEPNHFYRPAHIALFESIRRIYATGKELDQISITEDLKARNLLDKIGGVEYIFVCAEKVPVAANMKTYTDIVLDKALRRQIIHVCTNALNEAYDEDSDAPAESLLQAVMDIKKPLQSELKPLSSVVFEAQAEFQKIYDGGFRSGIPYGIPALDNIIYGAGPDAELTLIGARPSNGKTVLLLMLTLNAISVNKRVLFFSQETSAKRLVMRMIRNIGQVDDRIFRDKTQDRDADWERIHEACNQLYCMDDMLLINDIPLSINAAVSKTRKAIAKYKNTEAPIGLICVDYLQIVGTPNKENRNIEVQMIAQGLHNIAMQFGIPVVAASQLSRADGTPSLKQLREGGNQEAEADKVILIDNPPPAGYEPTRPAQLIVAKHKDGPCGSVHCQFNGAFLRFEELV